MSCIQITAGQLTCLPHAFATPRTLQLNNASLCTVPCLRAKLRPINRLYCVSTLKIDTALQKPSVATSKYRRAGVVCSFGGKGKSDDGAEASLWSSLGKAIRTFKKGSQVEDVLKQQIQNQEYFDGGDSGGDSGGSGGGGGFGESGDESLSGAFDEFTQVILATIGFVFLYIYIIEGEEINVIVKDTLKFIFTRQMSIRLRRLINQWKRFFERMREKEPYDPYWLEREIINTPTWYDHPVKYRWLMKKLESNSDDDEY